MEKKKIRRKEIGPVWLRWLLFTTGALCMGAVIAVMVLWINFDLSMTTLRTWAEKYTTYIPLTAILYAALVYLLGIIFNRLWLSALLVGASGLCLALVDYFKEAINGTPLDWADFGLAAQLGEVAGVAGDLTPPWEFWFGLGAVVFCSLVLLLFRKLTRLSGRTRFLAFSAGVLMSMFLVSPDGVKQIGDRFAVDVYARMPMTQNNSVHGMTIALWRDLVVQHTTPPTGYSEAYMEQVLSRIDELLAEHEPEGWALTDETGEAVKPNIIMILSEAFFDLTCLPDLTYERDPLEQFHALQEESISGKFHSHYLGYGTGYIEIAMQYGITNKDFGVSTNLCFLEDEDYEYFDALPEQYLNTGGYRAEMLHSYNNSLYNRTVTYPLMGYSKLMFEQDLIDAQPELGWEGGIWGGYYLQDEYLMANMLHRMQKINDGGERAFLYGISMGNHQPFQTDKFYHEYQIAVENETLSEEDLEIVHVMVEGITRADNALGELTAALRETDEPTIVFFYGDHRPNLFMTDGDTVYTKLGLCPENDTANWTAEQINDLYATDYLIWANDPALLRGLAGTEEESSITAIGPRLLELTGQPISRYWALLNLAREASLTNIDLYFVDGVGNPAFSAEEAELTEAQRELLELRSAVIYDTFFGKQYITRDMNLPAGT